MVKSVVFSKGKKSRNELRLPTLHYVVADDWINKLGEKPFCAWLKFHTWVDRTDEDREADLIPYTMESIAEKLEISKTTLYRTIIKPLWEYGLIDLIEYETSKRKAQKPVNIIVYESPKNAHETKVMAIEKLRDWKKDYGSSAQIYGLKGGRPKNPKKEDSSDETDRFKNETVEKSDFNRFKNETVDGFKNETVTVSETKPNNVSNISNNDPNDLTNESNNNNHYQDPRKKQNTVVVDEDQIQQTQSHIRYLFGNELPEKQVIRLLNICREESKDPGDVVQDTYSYFAKKQEHIIDLTASLIYGAKNGWHESTKTVQVKPVLDQKEKEFSIYNWVNPNENNKAQTEPEVNDSCLQILQDLQECVEYYQQSLIEHEARKEEMHPDLWEKTRKHLELELKAAQNDLMLEKERIQALAK